MDSTVNLRQLLGSVVEKAHEDGIINEDEEKLIEAIEIEVELLENKIKNIDQNNTEKSVLQKLLTSANKNMLRNIISKARTDGKISPDEEKIILLLFKELGFDIEQFQSRLWFVFKICVNIEYQTPVGALLDTLDNIFCLRGIDPKKVYSGLCLGTKHYVIKNIDVTLLIFAITPDTTSEWVTKGAFATIDYEEASFERILEKTANNLLIENYISKLT